jgi:hypothetical protein
LISTGLLFGLARRIFGCFSTRRGAAAMQGWQTPYLGLRELPREITEFELQAFFTFSRAERELIEARRGDNHKLGLALHIGFVRMSGRPLNSVRPCRPALLRHLGQMLGIDHARPGVAARAVRPWPHPVRSPAAGLRGLGFAWMSEHQRRALVRSPAR